MNMLSYALNTTEDDFIMTRIGCGLAGYSDEQIAPMFKNAPSNVKLPEEWNRVLNKNTGLTMDGLYDSDTLN